MFDLSRLSARSALNTRIVTPENVYGRRHASAMTEYGSEIALEDILSIGQKPGLQSAAGDLGRGFKVRPCIEIGPAETVTLLDLDGPSVINHIWMTFDKLFLRHLILRMYWDGEEIPSVEVPAGDFFCNAPGYYGEMQSILINVNPIDSMHSFIPMPFRKHAKITIENRGTAACPALYYLFSLTDNPVPEDEYYFHAGFHRENPTLRSRDYTILDGVHGEGRYLGTYMTWQQNSNGWWGEGEVKMFLDGDEDFPTLCGTGTEDYFGGAWGFARAFSGPFSGNHCHAADEPGARHAMYRWHVPDPVMFHRELKVTIQCLGWRSERRYLPLQDDVSSVAYFYQSEPHRPLPNLPSDDDLEVV